MFELAEDAERTGDRYRLSSRRQGRPLAVTSRVFNKVT